MLMPRFSLRRLLLFTAFCAPASLVLRAAWMGAPWARGILVGIAFVGLTLCVHAAFFALMWPLSLIARSLMSRSRDVGRPPPPPALVASTVPEGHVDDTDG